jgi:hypothetical protein
MFVGAYWSQRAGMGVYTYTRRGTVQHHPILGSA